MGGAAIIFASFIYIFGYRIWDSADIEYSFDRISSNPDENIYYAYVNYCFDLLNLSPNLFEGGGLRVNNSYERYHFYSQYFGDFELFRLFFLIVNLPLFIFYVYYAKKTAVYIGSKLESVAILTMPGVFLTFLAPTLDATLMALTSLVIYLMISGKKILSLLFIIIYFVILNDKGVAAILLFSVTYTIIANARVGFMKIFIIFSALLAMPSAGELTVSLLRSFFLEDQFFSHYANLVESTIGLGSYPIAVLVLSIAATTSLAMVNYPLLGYLIFVAARNIKIYALNEIEKNIIKASMLTFGLLVFIMPNMSLIRQHTYFPILLMLILSKTRLDIYVPIFLLGFGVVFFALYNGI